MLIGEVARITGFPPKTIRYYESISLLPEPQRQPSGYRRYDTEHIRRLEFVRLGKTAGLSLTEIADIIDASAAGTVNCEHTVELLDEKLAAIRCQLSDLQQLHDAIAHTLVVARRGELRPSASVDDCPVIERTALERMAAEEAMRA